MTDHPTAIFASQLRPGMRCELPNAFSPQHAGIFTVTQTARDEYGIHFLGVRDNGSPYTYQCGPNMAWLCHDSGALTPGETVQEDV